MLRGLCTIALAAPTPAPVARPSTAPARQATERIALFADEEQIEATTVYDRDRRNARESLVPPASASRIASRTAGWSWPRIIGPHEPM